MRSSPTLNAYVLTVGRWFASRKNSRRELEDILKAQRESAAVMSTDETIELQLQQQDRNVNSIILKPSHIRSYNEVFSATYYDDEKGSLASHGVLLRRKWDEWEVKIRAGNRRMNKYTGIRGCDHVRQVISQITGRNTEEDPDMGLSRLVKFLGVRRTYLINKRFEIAFESLHSLEEDEYCFGYEVQEVQLRKEVLGSVGDDSHNVLTKTMNKNVNAFVKENRWAFPTGQTLRPLNSYLAQKREEVRIVESNLQSADINQLFIQQ